MYLLCVKKDLLERAGLQNLLNKTGCWSKPNGDGVFMMRLNINELQLFYLAAHVKRIQPEERGYEFLWLYHQRQPRLNLPPLALKQGKMIRTSPALKGAWSGEDNEAAGGRPIYHLDRED